MFLYLIPDFRSIVYMNGRRTNRRTFSSEFWWRSRAKKFWASLLKTLIKREVQKLSKLYQKLSNLDWNQYAERWWISIRIPRSILTKDTMKIIYVNQLNANLRLIYTLIKCLNIFFQNLHTVSYNLYPLYIIVSLKKHPFSLIFWKNVLRVSKINKGSTRVK